jgi:hypothetical protein
MEIPDGSKQKAPTRNGGRFSYPFSILPLDRLNYGFCFPLIIDPQKACFNQSTPVHSAHLPEA